MTIMMKRIEPKAIGERLRLLRKTRNISQIQLCEKLGFTPPAYNNYERGAKRPTPDNALILATFYGATLDYIYTGNLAGVPHLVVQEIEKAAAHI
jgi:transcriptional regulator with XRE-family HTH domain